VEHPGRLLVRYAGERESRREVGIGFKNLLSEALAFQEASLVGECYEEISIVSRNCEENSRGQSAG